MTAPLPLIVADGWDAPLSALRAAHPELEVLTVTTADDLRSASEQIAAALLSGRELKQRRVGHSSLWLERAIEAGQAIFLQSVGTWRARSEEWLENIVVGGDSLLSTPGFEQLAGTAAGARAFVVGAGPSLDRIAPYLTRRGPGDLVIAAGSALGPLAARGLTADLACLIEGRDCSGQYAPPVSLEQTIVVVAQHGHPAHRRAPARAVFRADLAENGWYTRFSGSKRALPSGGNVGAFALVVAAELGCREVLLAGLDFAVSDGADHAIGAGSPAFGADAGERVEVVGVGGSTVSSSRLLVSYRTHLEGIVHALRRQLRVINLAGRGAARIAGSIELDPAALVGSSGEPPAFDRALLAPHEPPRARWPEALAALEREWVEAAALAERLTTEAAAPEAWRARFGPRLAAAAGSFSSVLLRGHLLAPEGDPARELGERLAYGRGWLARWRAALGCTQPG